MSSRRHFLIQRQEKGADLSPRTLVESVPSQIRLSFNIESVDQLFPGFALGNFAVLHGSSVALSLLMLLCVRAQLPHSVGGLESNVVFVDGGNTFRLYDISYVARLLTLDPAEVLNRIFISRAFTAYQMTSLILDELKSAVEMHDSKLIIISDITGLYLDKDVPEREARDVFNQLTTYLSRFTEENRVVVVATHIPRDPSKRSIFFKEALCGRANVVAVVKPSKHGHRFVLEKHSLFKLGSTCFPSTNLTLTKFMEV